MLTTTGMHNGWGKEITYLQLNWYYLIAEFVCSSKLQLNEQDPRKKGKSERNMKRQLPCDNSRQVFRIISLKFKKMYVLNVSLTMSIPPPDLILLKYWPSAGYALVFPFILKSQIYNLLLCKPLHVRWQCDSVVCQLWDLWGRKHEQGSLCECILLRLKHLAAARAQRRDTGITLRVLFDIGNTLMRLKSYFFISDLY